MPTDGVYTTGIPLATRKVDEDLPEIAENFDILAWAGITPGANIGTFLATPSSANLAAAITDETGSGLAVFNNEPLITNPVITNIAPAADFTLTQNSVTPFTSVNSGAVANTLYLKAGNVGIGTTNPSVKNHTVTSTTAGVQSALRISHGGSSVNDDVAFDFLPASGALSNPAKIVGRAPGSGVVNLSFLTVDSAPATEKMTITGSGNVGIGTTSPEYQLHLSSDSAVKPSTNTWTVSSDERLKSDIQLANLDRCYEIVKFLPLKRFKWKDNVYTDKQVKDRAKLGWIAQDVKPFFNKAINQSNFKLLSGVAESIEEYEQETIEQDITDTSIEVVEMDGKFIQKTITNTRIEKVPQYDEVQLYDEQGNPVVDKNGKFVKHKKPRIIKVQKTRTKYDSIADCYDMNADQIYAALYGCVQKLQIKVEALEAKTK